MVLLLFVTTLAALVASLLLLLHLLRLVLLFLLLLSSVLFRTVLLLFPALVPRIRASLTLSFVVRFRITVRVVRGAVVGGPVPGRFGLSGLVLFVIDSVGPFGVPVFLWIGVPLGVPVIFRVGVPVVGLFDGVFGLVGLFDEFFHGLVIFGLQVFADLFDDFVKGGIYIRVVFLRLLVHLGNELNKRVLYFSRSIGKNHHNKIPHQVLPVVKAFGGLVVHYPGIMKFAEAPEIHRDLVIQSHQFRRTVEVLQVFMVVQHLDETLHQLPIDVHRVLVEPIVEVVSELLVLGLPVAGVPQVVLVEGMLEDILRLHDIHRPSSHNYKLYTSPHQTHLKSILYTTLNHLNSHFQTTVTPSKMPGFLQPPQNICKWTRSLSFANGYSNSQSSLEMKAYDPRANASDIMAGYDASEEDCFS